MKTIVLTLLAFMVVSEATASIRKKRDIVCATFGDHVCPTYCRGKGHRDGSCEWDEESGAFNCVCSEERAGIQCNLGGPNVCHYSCVIRGYVQGDCDENMDQCNCSGGNNSWGNFLQNIMDRF